MGVVNSVTEVAELAGRRLIADDGRIIQPGSTDDEGCDIYISTSSAGGGLQMMVAGVVREMTAASAKRAALGAGAIVMDVIASQRQASPARADPADPRAASRHDPGLGRHRRRQLDAGRPDRRARRAGEAAAAVRQRVPAADHLRGQRSGAGRDRRVFTAGRRDGDSTCRSSRTSARCSSRRTSGPPATASTTSSSST